MSQCRARRRRSPQPHHRGPTRSTYAFMVSHCPGRYRGISGRVLGRALAAEKVRARVPTAGEHSTAWVSFRRRFFLVEPDRLRIVKLCLLLAGGCCWRVAGRCWELGGGQTPSVRKEIAGGFDRRCLRCWRGCWSHFQGRCPDLPQCLQGWLVESFPTEGGCCLLEPC